MHKIRLFAITPIFIGTLLFCNRNQAFASDFSGPISAAMGGSGRGTAVTSEAQFLNPAGLSFLDDYHFAYFYRYHALESAGAQKDWALNLVDANPDSMIPAAFSYLNTQNYISATGARSTLDEYRLSLAKRIREELGIGFSFVRWMRSGLFPQDLVYQASAGVLYRPFKQFHFGFTAENVLDKHRSELRPQMGLGAQFLYEELFRARMDLIYPTKFNPRKKGIVAAGAETLFSSGLRFRFGGRWDDVEKKTYGTVGLGWDGPRLAADWAFEKNVYTQGDIRQTFDLRLFF